MASRYRRSGPDTVTTLALALGVTLFQPATGLAQVSSVSSDDAAVTTWSATNWTRVEGWRFFEPEPGGGDASYAYAANRLQIGARRTTATYDATGTLQYVQFGGLPSTATGPGPLGLGAVYFGHAGRSDSRQVYLRYLNVRLTRLLPRLTLQVGRMAYALGGERPAADPKVSRVTRLRLEARLLGEFEWSLYQRGYDGVRADVELDGWSATGVLLQPTQGGFEDAAGLSMRGVRVAAGSVTGSGGGSRPNQWRAFVVRYRDTREVAARPDNSGRAASRVDVDVTTIGASLVGATRGANRHQWDWMVWSAGQLGDWYGLRHRAYTLAAELGHQWMAWPGAPWVRGGALVASGDEDGQDDRHTTFFQMLPTVRKFSLSASYSQMNHTDVFVQVLARPLPDLGIRFDVHKVGLATAADRWYFGSGAAQSRGTIFGFGTRPSANATDLGVVVEGSADYTVGPHWSANAYLGVLRGGEIVRRTFAGRTLTFAYVENVIHF